MSDPLVAVPVGEWADPESVFCALFAGAPHSFWLDSGPGAADGWSWVGSGTPEPDVEAVRRVSCTPAGEGPGWAAGPFRGGWVGWLGYEDGAHRAGAPRADTAEDEPGSSWLRVDRFVAFDHTTRTVWAVGSGGDADDLAAAVATVAPPPPPPPAARVDVVARHAPEAYASLIERCRDAIREGDAYQLCLTTRFEVAAAVDAIAVYRRLRTALPTHHGGFIRAGDIALASATPERFLEIGDGARPGERIVRTRPIKGTRPRGGDAASDAAAAAELIASEKERAENVMIVDLMRNDLSRVCDAGTVGVDRLLEVESYRAVHQLVSTVSGRLAVGTTVGDVLDAAFPAGSMTGAPKLSAMTILHGLEGGARGVFAGCFGWVGADGSMDLAMVIRSVVAGPRGAYVGAGGGITWRSVAAAEVAEVAVKARAPLAALGARLPAGWDQALVG